MVIGIIPDKKLIAVKGCKAIVNLPFVEYVVNVLAEHYRSHTTYCPVTVKIIRTDDHITYLVSGVLRIMDYMVDVTISPVSSTYDVLFVPSGYTGDALKNADKVIEY